VAAAIQTRLNTIPSLKVYLYEPKGSGFDALPAATIDGPNEVVRSDPEAAESQLGTSDWRITWTVRFYVDDSDRALSTPALRALLGQAIAAIDADRSLGIGGTVLDASLVRASFGGVPKDETHQFELLAYECELETWVLV
jgi:hypothetical protein